MNLKRIGQFVIIGLVVTAGYYFYTQVQGAVTIGKTSLTGVTINKTKTPTGSLQTGLIGHWTFDGKDMVSNVADISGQGNNGTLSGQTSTTTVIGKVGQALDFDGVDDYVVAGDTPFDGAWSNRTISAWIKLADTNVVGRDTIVGKFNGLFGWQYMISPSEVQKFTSDGGGFFSSTQLTDTKWHFVSVVTGASDITFYLDGNPDGSSSGATYSADNNNQLSIGSDSENDYFAGSMDDVRIYNRALSAVEIKQLYDSTKGNVASKTQTPTGSLQTGLIGHWTFDGPDMISNVADISGQGNNGSLNGQTSTTTVIGKVGQALEFDGANNYVDMDSAITILAADTEGTVSFWTKIARDNDLRNAVLTISSETGATASYFSVEYDMSSGKDYLRASLVTDGTTQWDGNTPVDSLDQYVGEWLNVTMIHNGTKMKIYFNGVLQTRTFTVSTDKTKWMKSVITDSTNKADSVSLGLNRIIAVLVNPFEGNIDDVRIYNRALSADEVKQLYNLSK